MLRILGHRQPEFDVAVFVCVGIVEHSLASVLYDDNPSDCGTFLRDKCCGELVFLVKIALTHTQFGWQEFAESLFLLITFVDCIYKIQILMGNLDGVKALCRRSDQSIFRPRNRDEEKWVLPHCSSLSSGIQVTSTHSNSAEYWIEQCDQPNSMEFIMCALQSRWPLVTVWSKCIWAIEHTIRGIHSSRCIVDGPAFTSMWPHRTKSFAPVHWHCSMVRWMSSCSCSSAWFTIKRNCLAIVWRASAGLMATVTWVISKISSIVFGSVMKSIGWCDEWIVNRVTVTFNSFSFRHQVCHWISSNIQFNYFRASYSVGRILHDDNASCAVGECDETIEFRLYNWCHWVIAHFTGSNWVDYIRNGRDVFESDDNGNVRILSIWQYNHLVGNYETFTILSRRRRYLEWPVFSLPLFHW